MQQEWMQTNLEAANHRYMAQHLLPILEHFLPGIQERHSRGIVQDVWSKNIDSEEFSGKGLPAFGTPEFDEAAKDVHAKNPWLNDFDPKGPDGKQLPIMKALEVKAAVTARLLAGDRVDPKKVTSQIMDALQVGKRSAEKSNRRVSAGRMLGHGKTAGTMAEQKERSSLMDAFNSRHSHDGGIA